VGPLVARIGDPDIDDHLSPLVSLITERLRLFTSATSGVSRASIVAGVLPVTQEDQYCLNGRLIRHLSYHYLDFY
jgi:hypothetical protein